MITLTWKCGRSMLAILLPVAATGSPVAGQSWTDLPESERVEIMQEWRVAHDAAQKEFADLLMGRQEGPNGSDVLSAAAGLAQLAIAEGDYEDLPRRLDSELDGNDLEALRKITGSKPARAMGELLSDYRDLEYAYLGTLDPQPHRDVEVIQCIRLLPAIAAVRAAEGDFEQAYDTLTLLFPIADWLIKERPMILHGLLAQAAIRLGVRHVEELAQREPPTIEQVDALQAALVRAKKGMDAPAIVQGEIAYSRRKVTTDPAGWYEYRNSEMGDEYWEILKEAAVVQPWERDRTDLTERVSRSNGIAAMLMPEMSDAIDKIFEVHLRLDLASEMLDYYADGTLPEFPPDPFSGEAMRWRETGDGCVIYSIGRDREDQGGMDRRDKRQDYDVAWRLPCELKPESVVDSGA